MLLVQIIAVSTCREAISLTLASSTCCHPRQNLTSEKWEWGRRKCGIVSQIENRRGPWTQKAFFSGIQSIRMSHLGQGLHEEGAHWHLKAIVQQPGTGFTHYVWWIIAHIVCYQGASLFKYAIIIFTFLLFFPSLSSYLL